MATRRARVKLAPNLGISRNKNKVAPPSPKVVIKSDTENSESEAATDNDDATVTSTVPNIVENISKQIIKNTEDTVPSKLDHVEITPVANPVVLKSNNPGYITETSLVNGDSVETGLTKTKPDTNGVTVTNIVTNGVTNDVSTPNDVTITNGCADVKTRVRVPLSRNKFRPNLNFDRSRHGSGGVVSSSNVILTPRHVSPHVSPTVVTRARTVSSSSTNSETDGHTAQVVPDSPILRAAITTPKPARIRRTTESRSTLGDRSQFLRRKMDHKKKFSYGVPEHTTLTMFDLIYYNPSHGQRMSVDDELEETVDDPNNTEDVVENGSTDVVNKEETVTPADEEANSAAIPVPQVKVGANGEIIVDEASLQVETTQAKEAKVKLQASTIVFEDNKTASNYAYGRWSKKRRHNDWSKKETIKFFKALSILGSDFSMMESYFKNRSRQELKLKFKKEEKINGSIVDKCLKERGMFTDLDTLMKDSEDDDEDEDDFERSRSRKPKKKRTRRTRYKNRGYYESSSDGEEADVEASKSPVRKTKTNDDNRVVAKKSVVNGVTLNNVDLTRSVPLQNGVQFPPGLLAANPGLAGAKPGSLMVVAAPNKPDDNSLLSVYMVPDQKREARPMTAASPSHVTTADQSELRLDPAVVRAVNVRQRTVSESKMKRKRTISEVDDTEDVRVRSRQRTCSESGIDPHVEIETIRHKLLTVKNGPS